VDYAQHDHIAPMNRVDHSISAAGSVNSCTDPSGNSCTTPPVSPKPPSGGRKVPSKKKQR
jgi:hypothetical protein